MDYLFEEEDNRAQCSYCTFMYAKGTAHNCLTNIVQIVYLI